MFNNITKSERIHISFFGCINAGKSSVVNAVTNQGVSIVSSQKGTTTDPVEKAMEILPLGPVVIVDTAGIDDESDLGALRINKTKRIIDKTDIAVLVVDSAVGITSYDKELFKVFTDNNIPCVIAFNKIDLIESRDLFDEGIFDKKIPRVYISAKTGQGIKELKDILASISLSKNKEKYIIRDKLQKGSTVILVIPIDESAPKGRIILPQQNVLREILDAHAKAICCQAEELPDIFKYITPDIVITDSQAFNEVKDIVPESIILTSFSILMANYKGSLNVLVRGADAISKLKDGDNVLISEGCTHHRQCNDIGTVKIPKLISEYTGKNINFEFTQGGDFPFDLSEYSLVIHCGGCMLNEAEVKSRMKKAMEQNIPITNYGMAIAYMNGILPRAMSVFSI